MTKVTLTALSLLFSAQTAFAVAAPERNYVEGDGTLNLTCQDTNPEASPHNVFLLTLMYDENSENQGFDLISDDNLATGNGDLVYKMEVSQFPFVGAEILPAKQMVSGCEAAPLTVRQSKGNENELQISFECDGDGDAGYGQVTLNLEDLTTKGNISFPEGQHDLLYPISEDTQMAVSCTLL